MMELDLTIKHLFINDLKELILFFHYKLKVFIKMRNFMLTLGI